MHLLRILRRSVSRRGSVSWNQIRIGYGQKGRVDLKQGRSARTNAKTIDGYMEIVLFLTIAGVCMVSAFLVVTQRNVIYSALFLIVTFCGIALLYILLNAPFLAAIQVIVYAGAIIVLFLFVIMLLNLKKDEFGRDRKRIQKSVGILFSILLLVEVAIAIKLTISKSFVSNVAPVLRNDFGSPRLLGELLFTKYLLPFELTSVLLLVAIIGAIILAKKRI